MNLKGARPKVPSECCIVPEAQTAETDVFRARKDGLLLIANKEKLTQVEWRSSAAVVRSRTLDCRPEHRKCIESVASRRIPLFFFSFLFFSHAFTKASLIYFSVSLVSLEP